MQAYNNTDRQLHLLCQIIAKINRTFVLEKADDSHTNLYYDPLGDQIAGRWINTGNKRVIFTLHLKNLQFEVLDTSHQVVLSVATIDRTISEIENELERLLPEISLNPEGFKAPLHFEIQKYPTSYEPVKPIDHQGLRQWKY